MLGRVLCTAFILAGFTAASVSAACAPRFTMSVTRVTWQRDGVLTWERVDRRALRQPTIARLSPALAPGESKVIARGTPGLRDVKVRYTQRDGGPVHQQLLSSRVLRKAKPRIIAEGIGQIPLADFVAHGVARMAYMAHGAMAMVATAYSGDCAGCGGRTASGRPAGYGVVAVDPRVIPLGTRLYITGYGLAVAGDTGGAIVGNRIDLGFGSERQAMLFGRRAVTVYRL